MSSGVDDARLAVVFGVIGANAIVLITHVHMAVSVENFSHLPLLIGF